MAVRTAPAAYGQIEFVCFECGYTTRYFLDVQPDGKEEKVFYCHNCAQRHRMLFEVAVYPNSKDEGD